MCKCRKIFQLPYLPASYIQTSINISYSAHCVLSVEGVEMISSTQVYRKSVAEI
jgi:hypothetical protein